MKTNYDIKMQDIIKSLDGKKRILLHSCCGPCSSACIERLKDYFDITVLYYNPNIEPISEYEHRKEEQVRLLKELGINFLDCDYDNEAFTNCIKGLESEVEGGKRCQACFSLRLDYTAKKAQDLGYDYFATTLTVSPHKNSQIINQIGESLENIYNIKFLYSDFKKREGYKRSIELAKKYNLYRQNYCGCRYSKRDEDEE